MTVKPGAKMRITQIGDPPRGIPICSGCNKETDRPAQRYCSKCHAAYMREWRKTHPLSEEARKRDSARSLAKAHKNRGEIAPEPCRVCGDTDAQMHHPDHEQPLVIVWLCRKCHLGWHAFWRTLVMEGWAFWYDRAKADEERAPIVKDCSGVHFIVARETNDTERTMTCEPIAQGGVK